MMSEYPFDPRTFKSDEKWCVKYCINFMSKTYYFPKRIIHLFTLGETGGALDWQVVMKVENGMQCFTAIIGPEEHGLENIDEIRLEVTRDEFVSLLIVACSWFKKKNPSQIEELDMSLKIAGLY